MLKHISNENFYTNLTNDTRKKINDLNKKSKIYNYINILSIISFCIVGLVFIYTFRGIFFFNKAIYTTSSMIYYTKHLIIFALIIYSISTISKINEKNLDKALSSFKTCLLRDICNCSKKCNCRNSLIDFYKSNGYDITK